MKYSYYLLYLLFSFSCKTHKNVILEINSNKLAIGTAQQDIKCESISPEKFIIIKDGKESFIIECKNDYMGGFWLKRDPSVIIAQSEGDEGVVWFNSSSIFMDKDIGYILWWRHEVYSDPSVECEIKSISMKDCNKIPKKNNCGKTNYFYRIDKDGLEKIDYNGELPKRILGMNPFYKRMCN